MANRLLEAYTAAPYISRPIRATHVASLELMSMLHGLRPPSSDRCSVLELGCASGGNLIPMAAGLPASRFVGIDLAPNQIADGQIIVDALGLENITLRTMSITDVTPDFGQFDYIICHGVYSWVPPEVQDGILRVCSENLAPNGIAYVSYNTYPGWHMRGMVREMMMFHDDETLAPGDRVARARSAIEVIRSAAADRPSPYSAVLDREIEQLRSQDDAYLLHEQLEPFNRPVYFAEFARLAAGKHLRYVAEAKLGTSSVAHEDWLEELMKGGEESVVRVQQYIDFARGRTFRRTLLCHETQTPNVSPAPEAISELHVVMRAVPVAPAAADVERARGGPLEAFKSPDDVTMTTNNPTVVAALRVLHRAAPASLSFAELSRRVEERLNVDSPPGIDAVGNAAAGLTDVVLQCAIAGLVELFRWPSPTATTIPERPVASALVRLMAGEGNSVPNSRHYAVEVSGIERLILMHLDGTNTREQLLAVTEQAIADGDLSTGDEHPDRAQLAATIQAALSRFVAGALIEA